ncbi:MAG TPA: MFS transporter [Solirubrobacteraceae bacterium]|jgi:predicted MFS family arabinose efflux permease|nr:MFS transporter [Solirubrobacteraceae bacterium]
MPSDLATAHHATPARRAVTLEHSGGGWRVVAAYGAVAAATQMLWLTYAAITTETAHRYGVSVGAVGWLAEIFPLLYVVLAIPAGALLDRWFRPSLALGGALVAAGGLVRLGGLTFAWALAGQSLVALAQPVVMSAVAKLPGEYLPVHSRALGISLASAAGFLGMLAALLLGPLLGAARLELLLQVQGAIAVLAALALAVALRRRGSGEGERTAIEGGVARSLWARRELRVISGLAFLGFGVFVALSTWLQTLLHPAGISETAAGALLVGMIVAGVIGCAVLPPAIAARGKERRFMGAVIIAGSLGSIALGVLPGIAGRAVVLVAMGALLLPALPVLMTVAERLAGPAAGTAGAIVWLAGNLGGLVVALLVQELVHHPLAAFLAMAAVVLFAIPLAARMVTLRDLAGAAAASTAGSPVPPVSEPGERLAARPEGTRVA